MSALKLNIHRETPEANKIQKVVQGLRDGAVILYPTDTQFTLGCALSNKEAIDKIRKIRQLDDHHSMTFLCNSLSNISEFAKVSDEAYKLVKRLIPGPYTFILPATKNVPKFAQDPKRNTAGLRVPENVLSQALLSALGAPIISISARVADRDFGLDYDSIIAYFSKLVDIAVYSDIYEFQGESSIIDLTTDDFQIVREGAGMMKIRDFMYD